MRVCAERFGTKPCWWGPARRCAILVSCLLNNKEIIRMIEFSIQIGRKCENDGGDGELGFVI